MTIKEMVDEIDLYIDLLYKRKYELQDRCIHESATKQHKGNTGNYDPSADSLWIEYDCPECKLHWIVEQ